MACGHVSNALYTDPEEGGKIPVCSECIKIKPRLAKEVVDIKGRTATCIACGKIAVSSPALFSYHYDPDNGDTYYDWCKG